MHEIFQSVVILYRQMIVVKVSRKLVRRSNIDRVWLMHLMRVCWKNANCGKGCTTKFLHSIDADAVYHKLRISTLRFLMKLKAHHD